jgi:hypothetical protein
MHEMFRPPVLPSEPVEEKKTHIREVREGINHYALDDDEKSDLGPIRIMTEKEHVEEEKNRPDPPRRIL